MKDSHDFLPKTLDIIDMDLESILDQTWIRKTSGYEEQANYLYFLRDEINKRIRKANKARKAKEEA